MLIQGNCVKEDYTLATLALQADPGESFLIKQIYVDPDEADDYHVLRVDRKTVGVYRVVGKTGNHLDLPRGSMPHKNLMEFLIAKGINVSIPVAEGQQFTITKGAAASHVIVVYDIYEAADMRADMPNGSDAKEFTFIQYMDASTYPSVAADVELDVSLSPAEFPDFPCGRAVPARHTIDLLGLVGAPCGCATDPNNKIRAEYVKLVKDRETLFDEDRNGIPFHNQDLQYDYVEYGALMSLIGPCVTTAGGSAAPEFADPLLFDPPLHFVSGEELLVYITFSSVGTKVLDAGAIDLAAILNVKVE